MAIVLFDPVTRKRLYPFTYNHAIADLRMGILTIRDWWQIKTGLELYTHTEAYLQPLYAPVPAGVHTWIDATLLADDDLVQQILNLREGQAICDQRGVVAFCHAGDGSFIGAELSPTVKKDCLPFEVSRLGYAWEIFQLNAEAIREDFQLLTAGRSSQPISPTNTVINPGQVFIEKGATVEYCLLNATEGPIYIGKYANMMEGCLVRGPFAMLDNSVLKMGARIYGATTLGPCCVGGGEIKNVVMQGYSNKAHDGYLGDSVIGEWCNLGAGTSNSNVKNSAGTVKVWDPEWQKLVEVGQKCGLIMGDYTRAAINTSFNTGSYVGLCCNIFNEGFPPKVIPNFTWGGQGLTRYELNKGLQDIDNWKKLKNAQLTEAETAVLKYIFDYLAE